MHGLKSSQEIKVTCVLTITDDVQCLYFIRRDKASNSVKMSKNRSMKFFRKSHKKRNQPNRNTMSGRIVTFSEVIYNYYLHAAVRDIESADARVRRLSQLNINLTLEETMKNSLFSTYFQICILQSVPDSFRSLLSG